MHIRAWEDSHSPTVRSSRCLGRAGDDGLCMECIQVSVASKEE